MNMVRAGVVSHPSDWRWCSYGELSGGRERYRLIDRPYFGRAMGRDPDESGFADYYRNCLDSVVSAGGVEREGVWTESLAVGSETYVRDVAAAVTNRRQLDVEHKESELNRTALRQGFLGGRIRLSAFPVTSCRGPPPLEPLESINPQN